MEINNNEVSPPKKKKVVHAKSLDRYPISSDIRRDSNEINIVTETSKTKEPASSSSTSIAAAADITK